ncbi:winged helix DNA-binding domain-containing protein [Cystobasidium minutum MCA 4210]|uniref:winged helix DNA-binding domain-containing protein n=1 Tax=Cystobasidium minutum MCA 4210 TaxID=1397322 RepID=UPI0034CD9031|eukprot:jgi/Rhomi1/182937/fgenesh1_pm.2_\
MRRNVGLSSLSQQSEALASYSTLSNAINEQQVSTLQSQMSTFQSALRTFANKHRAKILSDPVFRKHFADMCNQVGVDPLGSGGRKGLWDFLGVGDWTFTLAVQVVDVCLASRERNGGLIDMEELIKGVTRLRRGDERQSRAKALATARQGQTFQRKPHDEDDAVTAADIERAIKALAPLGCGYSIINVGSSKLVRSVAAEFDVDSLTLLECAASVGKGYITITSKGWPAKRAENAINQALLMDAVVWLDDQEPGKIQYWVPSLFDFEEEVPP